MLIINIILLSDILNKKNQAISSTANEFIK